MLKNRGYEINIYNSDFLTLFVLEKRNFSKNIKFLIIFFYILKIVIIIIDVVLKLKLLLLLKFCFIFNIKI